MNTLTIKQVFRYARPYKPSPEMIEGFFNHFHVTHLKEAPLILLERGISLIADIKASDGKRKPAILIRSSPHKIGSESTPWQDIFDVDNGHIRYYGDNKTPGSNPALAQGNKVLLEAFETYNNPEKRQHSVPLIFYNAVSKNGKSKGYIEFNGFGIIKSVELVTQFDRKLDRTFSNFAFNFHVFSIARENETFDWRWINDRRDKTLTLSDTLRNAPYAWKDWIKKGKPAEEINRRRVSKLFTYTRQQQIPIKGSKEEKTLNEVYDYYSKTKSRFEGLACEITAKILRNSGAKYEEGWITPASSDGGADFYGKLEIGQGFGKAKLIVLGQAKCETLGTPTGGNHIARTVARLKRGWIGVYVTTSFFSEAVQREIIEDEYPIMLINGLRLAEVLNQIMHDGGYASLKQYLDVIDEQYENTVQIRKPDELLFG